MPKLLSSLKTIGTLALLLIAFPISCTVVLLSLLWNSVTSIFLREPPVVPENPKNILLNGGKMTKSLQLARLFKAAGHKVFLVETEKYWLSGHRFSNAVERFYTVPAPEIDSESYSQALLDIVKKENIDIFIPVSSALANYNDSVASSVLSPHCEAFHFDVNTFQLLDNKFTLCQKASSIDLSVPKTFLIEDPEQVLDFDFSKETRSYILKSIRYDSVNRFDLTKLPMSSREEMAAYARSKPISKDNPWIMQEFIPGQEYCTHSTVRDGVLRLHCCAKSSAFQVNYEHVENPQILQWVTDFVKSLNLTGQISFDFIQAEDGTVYVIECNPRTHSAITMFYNHPGVADAYLNRDLDPEAELLQPLPDSKPTYWLYHELWRLTEVRSIAQLQEWFQTITRGTDAIFSVNDPLPFLVVHNWQIPLLLLGNLKKLKGWVKIDFNIGKLIEVGES